MKFVFSIFVNYVTSGAAPGSASLDGPRTIWKWWGAGFLSSRRLTVLSLRGQGTSKLKRSCSRVWMGRILLPTFSTLRATLSVLFCCCLLSGLCDRVEAAPTAPKIKDVYVILLIVDGAPEKQFYDTLDRGELPNTKRYLVDEGIRFDHTLTIFPSATVTGYQAMVSGLFPGRAGIPYLEWFNRKSGHIHRFLSLRGRRLLNQDFNGETMFDNLAGHNTETIYSLFSHGATRRTPHFPLLTAWRVFVRHRYEALDKAAFRLLHRTFSRPLSRIPRFTMVGLLSSDDIGHYRGPDSPELIANFRRFDDQLGLLVQQLKQRGIWDKTYLVVTADHGMHRIKHIFDLPQWIAQQGLSRVRKSGKRKSQVFVGVRGIASATLTVRGENGWDEPIGERGLRSVSTNSGEKIDLLDRLIHEPALDLIVVRDGAAKVKIFNRSGVAEILIDNNSEQSPRYRYRRIRGDPLQIQALSRKYRKLTQGYLTARQWNSMTIATATPGAVPQLAQIFADGRAGDVYLIASSDWGFYHKKIGTHGSHRAQDMLVPMLLRGPGISPARRHFAQTVDLYPTMASWFGLQINRRVIDGIDLLQ